MTILFKQIGTKINIKIFIDLTNLGLLGFCVCSGGGHKTLFTAL